MSSENNSAQLSERSLYLFKALVEHFIQDGAPVGSRTLSKDSSERIDSLLNWSNAVDEYPKGDLF